MDFAVKKLVRADDIFLHVQILFLSLDTQSKKMVRAGIVFCFFRHGFSKIPYERGLFLICFSSGYLKSWYGRDFFYTLFSPKKTFSSSIKSELKLWHCYFVILKKVKQPLICIGTVQICHVTDELPSKTQHYTRLTSCVVYSLSVYMTCNVFYYLILSAELLSVWCRVGI